MISASATCSHSTKNGGTWPVAMTYLLMLDHRKKKGREKNNTWSLCWELPSPSADKLAFKLLTLFVFTWPLPLLLSNASLLLLWVYKGEISHNTWDAYIQVFLYPFQSWQSTMSKVYFDMTKDGSPLGRIVFDLYDECVVASSLRLYLKACF